jgi:CheY-like chemotaxis protein
VTQLLQQNRKKIKLVSAHEPYLGLDLAVKHDPSLILLDINLPGMDGFEVLKRLRTQSRVPVFAISASAMPSDIEAGLAAGFDNYLTKPINVAELLRLVDEALSNVE